MPSSMTRLKRLSASTGPVNSGKCCLANSTTDAAISTADDQHLPGPAVGEDRNMGHHLVIDELVLGGDLDGAVEHQRLAEKSVLEQNQMLVLGLHLVQHPLDLIGHAEAEVIEQ